MHQIYRTKPSSCSFCASMRGAWWEGMQKTPAFETAIGCHTFRATGLTDYLTNGGRIEVAQRMTRISNAKTTGLYDRRSDDISLAEVAKIAIRSVAI